MPTLLVPLSQNSEEHQVLHDAYASIFLEGECYAFALALSEGLGWPLVGLIKAYDENLKRSDVVWHTGVRAPDGKIHDVRGLLSEEVFAAPFLPPPLTIREVTKEELYATRPIDDLSIAQARRLAEALWPELPWTSTADMHATAFADELEALSRKYNLWICGSVPADPPRLYAAGGEEGGYRLHKTTGGMAHTITRYFHDDVRLAAAHKLLFILDDL